MEFKPNPKQHLVEDILNIFLTLLVWIKHFESNVVSASQLLLRAIHIIFQRALGDGIIKAGAHLTVLDLSDNAFGPNGMKGLTDFLSSASCYSLQELKLHNNGLGITGGKVGDMSVAV